MTGHDLRWGRDPGCTYKDKVVVVSVPHDGGWEDWWRGGMVGYTPGGTAPPLRLSPCRPPGVIHMNLPKKEELATHGPWVGNQACLLEDLLWRQRKDLKRSWVSPNRQQRKGFLPALQPWMNCFANSDQQERLKWGGHAVQVAWATH